LAGAQEAAKPAAASQSAAASQPEPKPSPELKPSGGPEPVSEGDPGAEPEMTLVPGTTPAASAPATRQPEQTEQTEQAGPAGPDPSMEVTVVPGVPRYHNANCILIRFMGDSDLDKMTRAAAREHGCTPCRACLPDQPERSPE
jgi:hypothetical protein